MIYLFTQITKIVDNLIKLLLYCFKMYRRHKKSKRKHRSSSSSDYSSSKYKRSSHSQHKESHSKKKSRKRSSTSISDSNISNKSYRNNHSSKASVEASYEKSKSPVPPQVPIIAKEVNNDEVVKINDNDIAFEKHVCKYIYSILFWIL